MSTPRSHVVQQRGGHGLRRADERVGVARTAGRPRPSRSTAPGRSDRRARRSSSSRCEPVFSGRHRSTCGPTGSSASRGALRCGSTMSWAFSHAFASVGPRIGRNATWMRGRRCRPIARRLGLDRVDLLGGVGERLAPQAVDVGLRGADRVGRVRGPAEGDHRAGAAAPGTRRSRSRRSGSARPSWSNGSRSVQTRFTIWMYSRVRS